MRKVLVLLLLVLVAGFMVACGGESDEGLTLEEKVTNTIYEVAGKDADGEDTIISVEISEAGEVKAVLRKYPFSDMKDECLRDSKEILQELAGKSEIKYVSLEWNGKFTDQYGQSEWKPAVTVGISRKTMDKIGWEDFDHKNLENIADQYGQHPAL